MKDPISISRLKLLHPVMQELAKSFIEEMENMGLVPRITQGLRTIQEQNGLYALGRTSPGKIVTNAKGGESWHNRGVSIDIAFIRKDGTIDFVVSDAIGKLGESHGLEWGGRWKGFPDRPHFQLPGLPQNPRRITSVELERIIKLNTKHKVPQVKKEEVAEWAKTAFKNASKRGFTDNDLLEVVGTPRFRKCLLKAGFDIKDTEDAVTYQELIVVLDRKGLFT